MRSFWSIRKFGNEFPALHGLRFLAVILIIEFHVAVMNQKTATLLRMDYPVVTMIASKIYYVMDFFFVLSGFLIGFIFLKSGIKDWGDFKNFYIRRSFRTLPLYFAALAIVALVFPKTDYTFASFLREMFFLTNYPPDSSSKKLYMGWSWALSVEEHFYLICPLIMILFMRFTMSRRIFFVTLICIAVFCLKLLGQAYEWQLSAYHATHMRLDNLLLGILTAFLIAEYDDRITYALRKPSVVAFVWTIILSIFIAVFALYDSSQLWNYSFGALPSVAICLLIVIYTRPQAKNSILAHRAFHTLATFAYGMYLFHIPVLRLLNKAPFSPGIFRWIILTCIAIVVCIVISYVLHLVLEKPLLTLRDRINR